MTIGEAAKVLVTGGAGFIGSHSVEALLETGASVRVLDDFSNGRRENLPTGTGLGLEVVQGDIRDLAAVRAAMRGITHVLHLAAQVSVQSSIEDPSRSTSVNVLGFVHVLQAAHEAGVRRMVYASSAAVYGAPQALPLSEDSPAAPISPYGLEKLIDDRYAALFAELHGSSLLGLRYFNVYGPRQDPRSPYAGVISKFIERTLARAPLTVFGDGGQTRDFIFVRDVARANLAALGGQARGVCNVATGSSVSLLELIASLGRCAGRSLEVRFADAATGDVRHSAAVPRRLASELGVERFVALDQGLAELLRAQDAAQNPA